MLWCQIQTSYFTWWKLLIQAMYILILSYCLLLRDIPNVSFGLLVIGYCYMLFYFIYMMYAMQVVF
jgi:hypothetical protein